MILRLIRNRAEKKRTAQQFYGSIVAQARREEFYRCWHVPDTINGRFDMIVLHLFLVLRRLHQEGEDGTQAGRLIIEAFFSDMDNSVREQGAGDLAVPKHVRKMADAFYGRLLSYKKSEESGDRKMLVEALKRNFFPDLAGGENGQETQTAEAIARYMQDAKESLRNMSFERLRTGPIAFPKILPDARASEK